MEKALVSIVMGSDSDLPVMKESAQVLEELGIGFEMLISSAHRVPEKTADYAKEAADRGIEVIIAGAGGAAHLPGVIAAMTPLPVIGVPVNTFSLGGVDSLYSIVQMPAGIPVATVAIDGARNAGILAAQILGNKYPEVRENVVKFKKDLAGKVNKKAELLHELGYKDYLKKFSSKS
ncbi:5-(carboxyamino)imidazole ribonucleotide mutase [Candidatus Contubernalis alkaliaceticus]|uniref:5-(carboxyamino)imidazole ribonucleotide mutase n=1 Tax=Candidatus Contubernalis alkaliaceticus TaxID=338645 RepID=UPI001F4C4863|nr:5-(carboxyamino)imidazole ribonucleotide mutase [Candidatus Contubernalis alkalaceticus]UNC91514.1 5-(carboxyamino)imidazole ribonucleotide mutase [Candidatus Contubernalis alkalaceticus]